MHLLNDGLSDARYGFLVAKMKKYSTILRCITVLKENGYFFFFIVLVKIVALLTGKFLSSVCQVLGERLPHCTLTEMFLKWDP